MYEFIKLPIGARDLHSICSVPVVHFLYTVDTNMEELIQLQNKDLSTRQGVDNNVAITPSANVYTAGAQKE